MDKTYSPQTIEANTYQNWENAQYFSPKGQGQPYCIMLPPPNVTGSLHMGHGFQHTIMDILTRYHRMMGDKVLWQPGTDHAGISTQLVVERQLNQQGISRKDLSREAFVDKIWEWKEQSGNMITSQMRRLGTSPDWSRERFTMDEGLSNAVQKVFIQLYDEGLIYRGTRLVNWDPTLGTAISDLEVIPTEEQGHMWHIKYPLKNGQGDITVATTRPETLLGDMAVAVNPNDERYRHLIGQEVLLPLCDRTIPIIADEYVDQEFGSGCVKITPAHDFNDYEVGKRHNLQMLSIMDKTAHINQHAPEAYQGLERFKAREQVIQDLTDQGYLIKVEPHTLKIPRGEKSNVVIEPLLTEQWYVKIAPLAQPAIDAVKNGEIKFVPESWDKTYFQWMENIEDWCISRQLWWGHRIPAWYDENGQIYVGYSENDVRFKYQLNDSVALRQDEDVLDTWFSSALWPFSTLGWPEKTPELTDFYPTSVLVTGFDIIFFWVARMIMMGLKFTGQVPFKEVIITGLIRDSEGQKMSKSKGNVLDPIDIIDGITLEKLIEKRTAGMMLPSLKNKIIKATEKEFPEGIQPHGTDALRFTYCALASNNRNVRFDMGRVEGYRNFCNKLWNASRFVLQYAEDDNIDLGDGPIQYSPADLWIFSKLQSVIHETHDLVANYRFDLLANNLHDFVWHEYCDWYLELSKPVLNQQDVSSAQKRGTIRTLVTILDSILRLIHPIMPYITETIWQRLSKMTTETEESLMLASFPKVDVSLIDKGIETEIDWLKQVIINIRTIRAEMNISPTKPIPVLFKTDAPECVGLIEKYKPWLNQLAKLESLAILKADAIIPESAQAIVNMMQIFIPLAGLIDKNAELTRLTKEITKLEKDIAFFESKLSNPKFVESAPKEIVEKEKQKLTEAREKCEALLINKQKIEAL
jgi:valyl-tRNA synthetase